MVLAQANLMDSLHDHHVMTDGCLTLGLELLRQRVGVHPGTFGHFDKSPGCAHWCLAHAVGVHIGWDGAGTVVSVSCGGAFGIEIVIEHPGGYYTQYAHLAAVTVDQGQRVTPGQWIGQTGTTGNSTGPHLHFEVRVTPELGSGVDPAAWLVARGVQL
jgi:hypothetical protein